jgi:hypothetical protein
MKQLNKTIKIIIFFIQFKTKRWLDILVMARIWTRCQTLRTTNRGLIYSISAITQVQGFVLYICATRKARYVIQNLFKLKNYF